MSKANKLYQQIWTERGATKQLRNAIESSRMAKLREALHLGLSGPEKGKKQGQESLSAIRTDDQVFFTMTRLFSELHDPESWENCKTFVNRILRLRDRIEKRGDSVEKIRVELSRILKDSIYQKLKDEDSPLINFLQILCIKLYSADGSGAFRQYAKDVGLIYPEKHKLKDLSSVMTKQLNKFFSHNRNNLGRQICWGISNPKAVIHSIYSNITRFNWARKYNSHQKNPSLIGHTLSYGDKSVRFVWGPGFTGDEIVEHGLLPAYKKFDIRELRFNHQDTHNNAEFHRIQDGFAITSKFGYEGRLDHVLLGFDTKAKNRAFQSVETIKQFINSYRQILSTDVRTPPKHQNKTGSGVYIPRDLLKDHELSRIFDLLENLFHQMKIDSLLQETKSRDLTIRAMLMVFDAAISSAIVHKHLQKLPEKQIDPSIDEDLQTNIVTSACKQGIDRAAGQANALRLAHRAFSNQAPLTQEEFAEISGSTLGRARLVEGRNILHSRYLVFDAFLNLISKNETVFHQTMQDLRDFLDSQV